MSTGELPDIGQSDEASSRPRRAEHFRNRSPSREPQLIAVIFGLLVVVTFVMVALWRDKSPSEPIKTAPPLTPVDIVDMPPSRSTSGAFTGERLIIGEPQPGFKLPLPSNPAESKAEARARAKSRVLKLQGIGRDIEESLSISEKNLADLKKQFGDLLNNETGRKLATRPELVERFDALLHPTIARPGMGMLMTLRERLAALLEPLSVPIDDAPIAASDDPLEKELRDLQDVVVQQGKTLQKDVTELTKMVASVRDAKAGTLSLQAAVDALATQRENQLAESRAAGRRKAEEAGRVALEEAEQNKRAGELALKAAEDAAKAAEAQRKADEAKEATARKQRLAKRKTEIDQYLAAFTAPGYGQPDSFITFGKTAKKAPVSLSGLKKMSALEESTEGLRRLHYAGGNVQNDRPARWVIYNHDFTVKAQQLLIELGDDMAAEGLLSP